MDRREKGSGLGPSGNCVCLRCGYKTLHVAGLPCFKQTCPKCGSKLTRER